LRARKYRGEFEERLKKIIEELRNTNDAILFIDETPHAGGSGAAEGAIDAAISSKPPLARASCSASARRHSTSTASTSSATRPWSGGSSRSWSRSRRSSQTIEILKGDPVAYEDTTRSSSPTTR